MLCQWKCGQKGALHTATLAALLARHPRQSLADIHYDTGLGTAWLSRFSRDAQDHYDVNKIEVLYTYLTGKTINV